MGSAWVAAPAFADHCNGLTGSNKDHLADGRCGYFVEPVSSPSPSPTAGPSPMPVSVINDPEVRIKSPLSPDGTAVRVRVTNWPDESQAPDGEYGWGPTDREALFAIRGSLETTRRSIVFGAGLSLFALAGVVVLLLPKSTRI